MHHPNHIDIPGMAIAMPLMGVELWYLSVPFEKRPRTAQKVEGWLMLALLAFLVARLFTNWGDHYF